MTKELIVSANSHESTVALLEDDQLVEITISRGAQHGLAGSIYKGRVTRVLPGMQSAFVNIGLDRDAFLYVSDFVGEMEELEDAADPGAMKAVENSPAKALEIAPQSAAPQSAAPQSAVLESAASDEPAGDEVSVREDGRPDSPPERREFRGRDADGNRQPRFSGREADGNRIESRDDSRERGRDRGEPRGDVRERGGDRAQPRDDARERGRDRDRNQPRDSREAGSDRSQPRAEGSAADGDRSQPRPEGDRDRERDGRRGRGRRSRRGRGRGSNFPDSKYARVDDASEPSRERPAARLPEPQVQRQDPQREDDNEFTVLPGESLAKYSGGSGRFIDSGEAELGGRMGGDSRGRDTFTDSGDSDESEQQVIEGRGSFDAQDAGLGEELGHRRGRPEFEQSMAGGENEFTPANENGGGNVPYNDAAMAEGDDDAEQEDDERIEGRRELNRNAAAEDDDDAGELALDDSEAEQVREAIASLGGGDVDGVDTDADDADPYAGNPYASRTGDDDTGDDGEENSDDDEAIDVYEASGEDTVPGGEGQGDTQAVAATESEPGDGGRQARMRGRGGSSRYVHRRGGRRGRRRGQGQGRGPQQAGDAETAVVESSAQPTRTSITDLLSAGQEILVQISKEPLGKKGARITSHIAMPGRYLVYMPTVEHVGVSRKIASDGERLRLRKIVQSHRTGMPGGFIVRTAGAGATEEEIRGDMLFLYNLWLDIRQKAEQRPAPSLIHQDLDIVERVLRDQLGSDFKTMWVDSEAEYERILRFVERFQPKLLSRVKLYTRSKPIFDAFNITPELEKALRSKVWLKSGGYIVINQTEALVAIDVNTGKFVGKSDRLEDTIVKTNLEAVQEIVRQIRLRDLGGIIVVDFIDMDDRKNRYQVMQALDQELRLDRAPSKSLHFNEFGLVAITRKRVKQSLERTLCTPCPYCTGSGFVKSVDTVIFEILSEAKKMAPRVRSRKDLAIRVNPEVARLLKSRDNSYLQEIEEIFKANVLVRGDVSLHREHFDIN